MILQTVAIVAFLVEGSFGGRLNPRQTLSSYTSNWNSSTTTSSSSSSTSYSSQPLLRSSSSTSSFDSVSTASFSTLFPTSSSQSTTSSISSSSASAPTSSSSSLGASPNTYGVAAVSGRSTSALTSSSYTSSSSTTLNQSSSVPYYASASRSSGLAGSGASSAPSSDSSSTSINSTYSPIDILTSSSSTLTSYLAVVPSSGSYGALPTSNSSILAPTAFSQYPPVPGSSGIISVSPKSTGSPESSNTSSQVQWPTSYSSSSADPSSGFNSNSVNSTLMPSSSELLPNSSETMTATTYASGSIPSASTASSGEGYNASEPSTSSRTPEDTATYSESPPFPRPSNSSSNSTNSSDFCGGATINIPDATLNWWYTTDFDFAAATFSAQYNHNDSLTGWTVLEATTTFDVDSAIAAPTSQSYTTFNTYINSSLIYYYDYTTPTPEYANTAVITQTATVPLNASTGTGDIPTDVMTTPAPASTVLPGPSSDAMTALTNTPFVYFSEFAIDSEKPTRVQNGMVSCVTSRQIHTLQSAYALYYADEDPEGQDVVTGDLPEEFLGELHALRINVAKLAVGTYTAEPTLLVVVEEVYVAEAVLAAHAESSQSALEVPSAAPYVTLTPSPRIESTDTALLLPTPTVNGNYVRPTGAVYVAHPEVSDQSLIVPTFTLKTSVTSQVKLPIVTGTVQNPNIIPFTASVGQSEITVLAPSNADGTITTTLKGNVVVTAKAAVPTGVSPPSPTPQGQPAANNLGGLGVIVSAIQAGNSEQANNGGSGSGGSNQGSNSGSSGSNSGSSGSGNGGSGSSGSESSGSGSGSNSGSSSGSSNNGGGSSGSGSGTNNNAAPAQQDQGLSNLISAIQQAGQSAGSVAKATAGSGSSGNGQSGSNGNNNAGYNVLIPAPILVGGVQTSISPSSNAVFGSQTLSPGGPAITVSGTPISLGPSAVVVGTVTHSFAASSVAANSAPSVITIGDATITQAPVPVFTIGGQTLGPGQTITVDSKVISIGSGGVLVIDGSTIPVANAGSSPRTLTAGGEIITVGSTPAFALGSGKVLVPGGAAIIVDGTQLSLAPSASALIIDGSVTSRLAAAATDHPLALTIGSNVLTANAATQFLLPSGVILTPGGQAIVSGTTISLKPGGSVAVINGISQTLAPPIITPAPRLTVGGTVFEPNLGSTYEIAGQQLTPGGVITAAGTTISLAGDASVVVVNGVTKTLNAAVASPEPTAAAVLTLGSESFTAFSGSTFVIDGSTLTPGGILTLGSGTSATTISLGTPGSGKIVINGVTSTISSGGLQSGQGSTRSSLTIAGQTFYTDSSGAYIIAGQTLVPGGSALTLTTQGGLETVSLDRSGRTLVVNGVTSTVAVPGSIITSGPLTINGKVYAAAGAAGQPSYVISGQTLTEGGVITISDSAGVETISLSSDGTVVVINGVSSTVQPGPTITAAPEITVDGQIVTAIAGRGTTYLISGKVLTPGGSVVFNGPNGIETVSLSPDGNTLIEAVSGAITTSALPTAFGIAQTAAPIITIGGETFTALPGSGPHYRLADGQTLSAGGPALTETIHGSVYIVSLSPSATVLVIEDVGPNGAVTKTEFETLFPATISRGRSTSTATTNVSGPTGTQRAGTSATGNNSSSQESNASLDRKIGGSLIAAAISIALFAILL